MKISILDIERRPSGTIEDQTEGNRIHTPQESPLQFGNFNNKSLSSEEDIEGQEIEVLERK